MRVLVTGASGQLGAFVLDHLHQTSHEVIAWSGPNSGSPGLLRGIPLEPVDFRDLPSIQRKLGTSDPDGILHLAALSRTDAVRQDLSLANRINVEATEILADWCAQHDRRFLFVSTDLVFDGSRPWWRENDRPSPVLAYGRTKRDAENLARMVPQSLILRLSLLFGFSKIGKPTFFESILKDLQAGQPRKLFLDEFRTPIDYETTAQILVMLLDRFEITGVIHVGGIERLSRFELIQRAAKSFGLDPSLVLGNCQTETDLPEPRPTDVSLDTTGLNNLLPHLHRRSIDEWSDPSILPF